MAADSDGCDDITTVVTCEGNLTDPGFTDRFQAVVDKLNCILEDVVKVHKLEPWNSVRVRLSIPREAALRLRKLASEGSAQLRALGILSVQVEGDQVISLRIANSVNAEPQEIRVQTVQDGSGSGSSSRQEAENPLTRLLGVATSEPSDKVQFKSPNVVCPSDSVVPKVPVSAAGANTSVTPTTKSYAGPFPFASMNQAIHSQVNYVTPPPPYPGKHPAVTISSPLLVNLLQNDGVAPSKPAETTVTSSAVKTHISRTVNLPRTITANRAVPKNTKSLTSRANTSSPSALSNTSIRQNSKPNSTMTNITPPAYPNNVSQMPGTTSHLPPPPPYTVAVSRQWDSVVQTSPFLDLTPSLTDLKADDLEHLLPTLERDLARSPPEIPEELTTTSNDKRNFLINPLTGELEPQSSCESDNDDLGDVFTGLPSPAAISDEDTNSTIRPDTTDQSDSETRSSHSDSGKHPRVKSKSARERGRDSPGLKPTEKIKLRLKLEKSEPINSAYKVDVSFIQQPKKASSSVVSAPGEELRVPPLHISLRGRNHAFITNKKKAKLNPDRSKVIKRETALPILKEKSPEPDKCNTPDRKQPDLVDKQAGRSPNSGAQGEDSGIESMDALSEKSPNQASQSPHADIPEPIKSKTQVPDMLDIEAQLAKMEGLNGVEDVNENQHNAQSKQCCELTSALQDSLKQGAVTLSSVTSTSSPHVVKEQLPSADISLVPVKSKSKEEELEPLPVRVTPPLYTYSNPEKSRGSESPTISDEDSNSCSTMHKTKSLLEQLLIEIPDNQTPSSPSPATRSVRTRALSKLNSPELNSPVSTAVKTTRSITPGSVTKRKRHESESSNNGIEDIRNKKTRKCSENAAELIKACMGVDAAKVNNLKKIMSSGKLQDESSDSDEPLIEKVRKTATLGTSVVKNKVKSGNGSGGGLKSVAVNTRRSVRAAIPAPNTRSKGDKFGTDSEALRRKTRSTMSDGDNKRKKEVK